MGASCCAYNTLLFLNKGLVIIPKRRNEPNTTIGERIIAMIRNKNFLLTLSRWPMAVEPTISSIRPARMNNAAAPVSIIRPSVEMITQSFIIQARAPDIINKLAIGVHFEKSNLKCIVGL